MPASKAAQQNKMRNRLIAHIGYLSARPGATPEEISAAMEGRVSPADVLAVWEHAGFSPKILLPGYEVVPVALAGRHRTLICREAQSRGMDLPDFAGKILTTVAADGIFGAVLDG